MSEYKPTDLRSEAAETARRVAAVHESDHGRFCNCPVPSPIHALQRAAEQVVVYGLDPARLDALRAALVRVDGEGA